MVMINVNIGFDKCKKIQPGERNHERPSSLAKVVDNLVLP